MLLILLLICSSLFELCGAGADDYRKYFSTSNQNLDGFASVVQLLLQSNYNPGATKTTAQMIEFYGYPSEIHKVVTEDGYILTINRIPHGKHGIERRNFRGKRFNRGDFSVRPVVFLQHGLFQSSYEWFLNKKENLLALQLADSGYDVWLGNSRGTFYSREHVSMTVKDRAYWEFSMHEMGKYDLPAEIDYILNYTRQAQMYYIGSSMGTSQFWILCSLKPEYNAKFRFMVGFSPVAYIQNVLGIPKFFAPFHRQIAFLLEPFFRGEIIPPWFLILYNSILTALCSNLYIAETFCANYIFLQAGWSLPQTQMNQLPLFYSHAPAQVSIRTLQHLAQLMNTGEFKEFDFGRARNLKVYGTTCPPQYHLERTIVPTALIYSGQNDAVVNSIDAEMTVRALPNVVFHTKVNTSMWNHFDWHLGRDVNRLVNNGVLKLLSLY